MRHNQCNQRIPPPSYNTVNQPIKPRIEFIDTAKGICILLVVMFHSGLISEHTPLLGMLRMPFYFTLSGLFFKDYGGFIPTLTKKLNKLVIPFLFFFTMSYAIFVAIRLLIGGEIDIPYYCFITSKTMVNVALWFLLGLFCANVLFYAITKICRTPVLIGLVCLLSSVFALNVFNADFYLPMYLDSGLAALPFFFFGYYLRKIRILEKSDRDKIYYSMIPLLLAIAFIAYNIGDEPYIGFGNMGAKGSKVCFFIGACCMVLATLFTCKMIGTIPGIKYIGRYSIIILGMHITIGTLSSYLFSSLGIGSDQLHNILQFTVSLGLSALSIPILIRYAPMFTAQKDLISPRRVLNLSV